MTRSSLFLAAFAAASVSVVAAPSSAQETPQPEQQAPVRGLPVDTSDVYTYRFDDDSMTAPGLGDLPKVRVLPRASRQTVLRPRASFIVPLIRSVETVGDPYPAPIRVRPSHR
jgi:hypothetical protein